jgi:hypothetical protein
MTFSSFQWLLTHPHRINSLRVIISGSWRLLLKFCFGQHEVTWVIRSFDHLCSENPVTLKINIVHNILSFSTHPCTTYSGKHNQSYHNLKTGKKHGFLQKAGNGLGFGARARISPWTELQEQIGQEWCITHDPVRIGAEFQSSNIFCSVLPFQTEIDPEWAVVAKLDVGLNWYRFRKNVLYKSCR